MGTNTKNNLVIKSIIAVIKNNRGLNFALLFTAFGVVLLGLVPPQILKYTIDSKFTPKINDGLLKIALIYMCTILFIGILDFMKEAILTNLGQKITKEIRSEMMSKLERIPSMYFTSNESGTVASRIINDVEAVNSMFTGGIIGMIIDCFKVIGIVATIWLFDVKLGILTLLLLPIIFTITRVFQKSMLRAQIENRIIVSKVNNHISESLKNIQMIKSYSKEKYMENVYTDYLLKNYETVEKVNFYDAVFSPIILLIRAVTIAAIVILASGQLNYLGISLGMVAASVDLISGLFTPIENLGMELQSIQQAVSGIHRVNEFYNEAEDDYPCFDEKEKELTIQRDTVKITFQDVSFCYEEENYILRDINLQISPLEKVAFAGRTGVGKTTMFKLILGLLKPTSGSILINGIDVYKIPNSDKRRIFGYVDQNIRIINGTIADQVSLRDSNITKIQIETALEFVGLKEYILSLEEGYDTKVKKDNIFSQGQKQLLAIARAIVTNPPVLLLDEITANLDSVTEEKILSVLQRASEGHTILSISHRLSSKLDCDTMVILEEARIKNIGSPEILLQKDHWYRSSLELEKFTWN